MRLTLALRGNLRPMKLTDKQKLQIFCAALSGAIAGNSSKSVNVTPVAYALRNTREAIAQIEGGKLEAKLGA